MQHLQKTGGGGGLWLTRHPTKDVCPESAKGDKRRSSRNLGVRRLAAAFLTSKASASRLSSFPKISFYSANQHLAKYEYDQGERYFKDPVHTRFFTRP